MDDQIIDSLSELKDRHTARDDAFARSVKSLYDTADGILKFQRICSPHLGKEVETKSISKSIGAHTSCFAKAYLLAAMFTPLSKGSERRQNREWEDRLESPTSTIAPGRIGWAGAVAGAASSAAAGGVRGNHKSKDSAGGGAGVAGVNVKGKGKSRASLSIPSNRDGVADLFGGQPRLITTSGPDGKRGLAAATKPSTGTQATATDKRRSLPEPLEAGSGAHAGPSRSRVVRPAAKRPGRTADGDVRVDSDEDATNQRRQHRPSRQGQQPDESITAMNRGSSVARSGQRDHPVEHENRSHHTYEYGYGSTSLVAETASGDKRKGKSKAANLQRAGPSTTYDRWRPLTSPSIATASRRTIDSRNNDGDGEQRDEMGDPFVDASQRPSAEGRNISVDSRAEDTWLRWSLPGGDGSSLREAASSRPRSGTLGDGDEYSSLFAVSPERHARDLLLRWAVVEPSADVNDYGDHLDTPSSSRPPPHNARRSRKSSSRRHEPHLRRHRGHEGQGRRTKAEVAGRRYASSSESSDDDDDGDKDDAGDDDDGRGMGRRRRPWWHVLLRVSFRDA